MPSLRADRVLRPDGSLAPGVVHWDGDTIVAVADAAGPGDGSVLAPGFVDVQVNGIGRFDVAVADGREWDALGSLLLAQGVTSWCPTLITMDRAGYAPALARIRSAMAAQRPGTATIIGAHLEGPNLVVPGAHPRHFLRPIDLDWLGTLPDNVALVTLAPELDDAAAATGLLTRRGVIVSLGHTAADAQHIDAAVQAGASMVTHLFNAMTGLHHRSPGVAATVLGDSRLASGLIADGAHVHPRMVGLAARLLAPDRLVLVTDAVAWEVANLGDGETLQIVDGAPRLADGTLAGSILTMDRAVRLCVGAGVPLAAALAAASTNPARVMHLGDRGVLDPGRRADLVLLGPDLQVRATVAAGHHAHPA